MAATGGNPLALIELVRRLDDEQLAGRRALDEPIRAGSAIEQGFARRLEQLSPAARAALTVAAASRSRDLGVIVAALVDLELGEERSTRASAPASSRGATAASRSCIR